MTTNKNKFDFTNDWYAIWLEQNQAFLTITNDHLKKLFDHHPAANPEDHFEKIEEWLQALNKAWQIKPQSFQQKMYENYWQTMLMIYQDATTQLIERWIKRFHEKKPIKNLRELYELWLDCCQEIYTDLLKNSNYQAAYGEFLKASLNYWRSVMTHHE